ncbi:GIY-YIG nuclease family protein [Shimia thalassica]|uniref:GIY-YIG nuclease family protein n=1 Tax=Shimia thalassica TaxID=1715693 RepID=UPI0026E36F1B|nr:GIY-YIG nuclease family protein [Shimia thalassica]MDO6483556.1 GIY-YIG nuclease family protein [Shimia thalassica]
MDWEEIEKSMIEQLRLVLGTEPTTVSRCEDVKAELKGRPVLYVIRIDDKKEAEAAALKAYAEYVDKREDLHGGKVQKIYFNNSKANSVFYVGMSLDIKNRLRRHLTKAGTSTTSLRLYDWGKGFNFCADIYAFPNECKSVLPAIEKAVQEHLKPAVGWGNR